MIKRLKNLLIIFLINIFLSSQINASAFFIYSAKSRSQLSQENTASTLLPSFRYDRNNIELNKKTFIDLLLAKDAKIVEVEIIGAEGTGLGIDNTTLLKEGLKILHTKYLRTQSEESEIETKKVKLKKNKIKFNLKKLENQPLIIEALDFKIFRVQVKGFLPGSYTVRATVDNNQVSTTTVFTKPDFRLDALSPSIIDPGVETTITLIGKGFDSLTNVSIEDEDIEIREIISFDENIIKVTLFAKDEITSGPRNITVTSPLFGKSSTIVNGLFINGPFLETDALGVDLTTIMDGSPGTDGIDGKDGKNICDDFDAMLMIFTNSIPPGSQATSFFDPVLCNLTFGIPIGFNGVNATGIQGPQGPTGANGTTGATGAAGTNGSNSLVNITNESSGVNCANGGKKVESGIDANNNNVLESGEVSQTNYVCNGATGATGTTGTTGATGANGSNSLVNVTNESSGVNCANGGKKVESGIDANNNNVLESGEVSQTNYVCNGTDGPVLPTIEKVIANWGTKSDEQEYTTTSSDMTRMVKIPRFIHDGIIYGGFWVDKYEAARADATSTAEGTSSIPIGKRNVVPWTNINYATARTNASASGRQISSLGSCHLIDMKEWHALYLLGRFAKTNGTFSATASNGWNERGNTRSGKDGRNSASFTCSDDPIESGGSAGRCLTGTGYKSWGHLLDTSATKDPDGTTLSGAGTADTTLNGTDAFDGDKQVYDLVGNIVEWTDFTVTKSGSNYTIDTGFQGANFPLPFTTTNRFFSFDDVTGNTNTSTSVDEVEFRSLGLPRTGATGNQTDLNGGLNDGKFLTGSTNQQYGTVRGGSWTTSTDSRSPLHLDLSTTPTTTGDGRGFRVVCDFSN